MANSKRVNEAYKFNLSTIHVPKLKMLSMHTWKKMKTRVNNYTYPEFICNNGNILQNVFLIKRFHKRI